MRQRIWMGGWLVGLLLGCTALPCPAGAPWCAAGDAGSTTWGWSEALSAQALQGALLSVWGSGSDRVFVVGGPLGNGQESQMLTLQDGRWRRLHPGGTETLWWVDGTSASDVWVVGEHGRIQHWNGSTFTSHPALLDVTLWGVWAASTSDVWAVGGTPSRGTAAINDVVLHNDGTGWQQEVLPGPPKGVALFKVWGSSPEDLYVVGEGGTIWHRQAGAWTLESDSHQPRLTTGTLFTVHGCGATDVYAVGGQAVLHRDGSGWTRLDVPGASGVNGVSCAPGGNVTLVGFGGLKMRRAGDSFVDDGFEPPLTDLHAAWTSPQGVRWVVGGDWLSRAAPGQIREGVVGRYGPGSAPSVVE